MGQRHQVYLIARVRPHGAPAGHPGNRRCIAGFHHQWCYGSIPLGATRRFLDLLRQPQNAAIVLAEIRNLDGKYGSSVAIPPTIPGVPCPYTTALLGVAWTTNLEEDAQDGYYTSKSSLPFDCVPASDSCWATRNDDGITIIDVTDPQTPEFCLITDSTLLDAHAYICRYYEDIPKPTEDTIDHDGPGPGSDDMFDWPTYERHGRMYASTTLRPGKSSRHPVPTRILTLPASLIARQAVETGCLDDLVQLSRLPEGALQVRSAIGGFMHYPDNAMDLLEEVLRETHRKHRSFIDLSDIQLSLEQILQVLSGWDAEVNWLNLSGNTVISVGDIIPILAAVPRIRLLHLVGCSSVEDVPLLALLQNYPPELRCLEGIIHPALLKIERMQPPDMKPFPSAFTFVHFHEGYSYYLSDVDRRVEAHSTYSSLALFTPAQIIQSISDVLPSLTHDARSSEKHIVTPEATVFFGCAALHGCTRELDQPWRMRTVASIPFTTSGVPRDANVLWAEGRGAGRREEDVDNTATDRDGIQIPLAVVYEAEVHHLQGFLESMAQEGRPMPTQAVVERLQGMLDVKASSESMVRGGRRKAAVEQAQVLLDTKNAARVLFPFLPNISADELEK
ncbi:uncharacterized protein BXZ73DRAFT_104409 [Epithele typhae]|uniref:uncharacterized protein n=1 Tax=Epithele typhae TaxID=378194 RepID=UPI0020079FCD|nr:uncharacterized protein BXZ73DRAFT_104409 [Epithele typhae]KAH9921523.1 hypothetical protein BXZ73DRAFT_104409 [Epithele typhae]